MSGAAVLQCVVYDVEIVKLSAKRFEFLILGEVFLGVVFHQKLIGGGLKCPTSVLHVENTCFCT